MINLLLALELGSHGLLGPELVSIPLRLLTTAGSRSFKYTYNCALAVIVLIVCFVSLVAALQFLCYNYTRSWNHMSPQITLMHTIRSSVRTSC